MIIKKDGKIGIGTTNPLGKFEIYNTNEILFKINNENIEISKSIIPTNSNVDIGDPINKIRDLYVSDSSIWIGDKHKIAKSSDGKLKFRKRKQIPNSIINLLNKSELQIISEIGKDKNNINLNDLITYSKNQKNRDVNISEIFTDSIDDYEEESISDAWLLSTNNNIYLGSTYNNVGIGTSTNLNNKLTVNGTIKATNLIGNLNTSNLIGLINENILPINYFNSNYESKILGNFIVKGDLINSASIKLNNKDNTQNITIKVPTNLTTSSYTLTLPENVGSENQVLSTDGNGILSFITLPSNTISNSVSNNVSNLEVDEIIVENDIKLKGNIIKLVQGVPEVIITPTILENLINTDYKFYIFEYTDDTNGLIGQTQYILSVNKDIYCDILIVGGGGGGGGGSVNSNDGTGGGGGAGGLVFLPNHKLNGDYKIKVGKGGIGTNGTGDNGITSSIEKNNNGVEGIDNFYALGGGGGGNGRLSNNVSTNGNSGGNGGGGGGNSLTTGGESSQNLYNGKGFGNNGGDSTNSGGDQSGGGGGAGGHGQHSYYFNNQNPGGEGGIGLHKVTINGIEYKFKDLFGTNVGEYIENNLTVRNIGTTEDYINLYYQNGTNTTEDPIPTNVEEGIYFAGGGAGKADRSTYGNLTLGGLGGGGSSKISTGEKTNGIDGTGGGGAGLGKNEGYVSVGTDIGTNGGSGIIILRCLLPSSDSQIIFETYSNDKVKNYLFNNNIGIGIEPIEKLDINGNVLIRNNLLLTDDLVKINREVPEIIITPTILENLIDINFKYYKFEYTGDSEGIIGQTQYILNIDKDIYCDILIIGGGGGGGGGSPGVGGGGGGGGLVFLPNHKLNGDYKIKVGKGGLGTDSSGENGTQSSIEKNSNGVEGTDNFYALGGGGGGGGNSSNAYKGKSGGNGGGSGGVYSGISGGESSQNLYNGKGFGNNGGGSQTTSYNGDQSGGGGGAGGNGQDDYAYLSVNVGGEGGIGLHKVTIDGTEYKFKDLFGTNVGEYIQNGSTVRNIGTAQNYFNLYYENGKNTSENPIPLIEEGIYFAGGGAGASDRKYSVGNDETLGGLGGGGSSKITTIQKSNGINGTGGGGAGLGAISGNQFGTNNGTNGGNGIVIIRCLLPRSESKIKYETYLNNTIENSLNNKFNNEIIFNSNIGIGIKPTEKLDIHGNILIRNNFLLTGEFIKLNQEVPEVIITPTILENLIDIDYKYYKFEYTDDSEGLIGQTQYIFNVNKYINCDILIVGGGGGGGGTITTTGMGGGGGGGGLVFLPNHLLNGEYKIKVGKGGLGSTKNGENGSTSSIEKNNDFGIEGIDNFYALGGGGGGMGYLSSVLPGANGIHGGSGGGGAGNQLTTGGESIQNKYNGKGFGNKGGGSTTTSGSQSGGGGGAGGDGQDSYNYAYPDVGGEGGIGLHKVIINNIEYKFKDLFGSNIGEYIQNGSTIRDLNTTAGDYFNLYYKIDIAYNAPVTTNTSKDPIPEIEEGIYFGGGGSGRIDRAGNWGNDETLGGLGGGGSTRFSTNELTNGINGTGGGGAGYGKISNAFGTNGGNGIIIIRCLLPRQESKTIFEPYSDLKITSFLENTNCNIGISIKENPLEKLDINENVLIRNNLLFKGNLIKKTGLDPIISPTIPLNSIDFLHKSIIFKYTVESEGLIGQTEYLITFLGETKCDILLVGGGGSGAKRAPGGGGAGGLVYVHNAIIKKGTYSIKVGRGGIGVDDGTEPGGYRSGRKGYNSEFDNIIALGGGAGLARYHGSILEINGGSGGGGIMNDGSIPGDTLQHLENQNISYNFYQYGNDGISYGSFYGGGGGAGGIGYKIGEYPNEDVMGGIGLSGINENNLKIDFKTHFNINDEIIGHHIIENEINKVYFSGGGGSYISGDFTPLQKGGGGSSGNGNNPELYNALPNTGGGGGGSGNHQIIGGIGGSGIVIIKYSSEEVFEPFSDLNFDNKFTSKLHSDLIFYSNIGIGIEPQEKLDINGNLLIRNNLIVKGDIQTENQTIIDIQENSVSCFKINNENIEISKSIIPTNSNIDIGDPINKIRDLYVSDSSIWIGDQHKIAKSDDGTLKFRKRKQIPNSIKTLLNKTEEEIISGIGKNKNNINLNDLITYSKNQKNRKIDINEIFTDSIDDYEEEGISDAWLLSTNNNIYLKSTYNNIGIGTDNPTYKLDVNGNIKFTGNLYKNNKLFSTNNLIEGTTNLYYTNDRFDTQLKTKNTDNLTEGTLNLYYTNDRFNTHFSTKNTDNLTEGTTNLYYTNDRFNTHFGTKNTDNLTEGTKNKYYSETLFTTSLENNKIYSYNTNIGIGIQPTEKLDINGNVLIRNDLRVKGNILIDGGFSNIVTHVKITDQLKVENFGTGPGLIVNQTGTQDIANFMDDGISVLFIQNGGNIGIGTLTPNYKLHVNGDINISSDSSFKINGTAIKTTDTTVLLTDTTPQLGGNLDVNGKDIISTSDGNININTHGNGNFVIKGNTTKGSGSIKFNCENNNHYVELKAPKHINFSNDITYTLPILPLTINKILTCDLYGNLEWIDNITYNEGTNIIIDQNNNINIGQLQDNIYRLNYESLLHPTFSSSSSTSSSSSSSGTHPTVNGYDVTTTTIDYFKYLTNTNNEHFFIFISNEVSLNTTFSIDFGSGVTIKKILLVAGGGGGAGNSSNGGAGGGGGGGVGIESTDITINGIYTVSVGKGGIGNNSGSGTDGENTSIYSQDQTNKLEVKGGGGGGGNAVGRSGGNGGGGGYYNNGGTINTGINIGIFSSTLLKSNTGNNSGGTYINGGGGGGAGVSGNITSKNGNNGYLSDIITNSTNSSGFYYGGGGGGTANGGSSSFVGGNGGNGGGGGGWGLWTGGNGGSSININNLTSIDNIEKATADHGSQNKDSTYPIEISGGNGLKGSGGGGGGGTQQSKYGWQGYGGHGGSGILIIKYILSSTSSISTPLYYHLVFDGTKWDAIDISTNFTGQHPSLSFDNINNKIGYIVVSSGKYINKKNNKYYKNIISKNININHSIPYLNLSNKVNEKCVFGVISDKIDNLNVKLENKIIINSLGEGAIWITNINGNLLNGDYITTSIIPGLGMKQNDDILHNYTVAKITMDCDFNPQKKIIEYFNKDTNKYIKEQTIFNEYIYDNEYLLKYVKLDGTIINFDEYNLCLSCNISVYKMAFVGCTYHCG
jgi:hypothetical protein